MFGSTHEVSGPAARETDANSPTRPVTRARLLELMKARDEASAAYQEYQVDANAAPDARLDAELHERRLLKASVRAKVAFDEALALYDAPKSSTDVLRGGDGEGDAA